MNVIDKLNKKRVHNFSSCKLCCTYLFTNPFGNNVIGNYDDAWSGHKPQGIEREKRVVKASFFRVVFQSEERRVNKHAPAH